MKNRIRFLQIVASLSLVLALVLTGVAYAITITVDGDEDTVWTTGSGGQTPGSTTDPNEGTITDNRDISAIYWTNDVSNFYLMLRTHGAPPSLSAIPTLTQIYFCIDIDNNTATGATYANCNNMSGIDRYIYVSATSAPGVYNSSFSLLGSGTLGYNASASTPVVEISVPNNLLGLSSANCTQTMPMVVYFDNGTTDPDDNTPDTGTINIGCGSPTAITLSDLNAQSTPTNWVAILLATAALLVVMGLGTLALSRRKA